MFILCRLRAQHVPNKVDKSMMDLIEIIQLSIRFVYLINKIMGCPFQFLFEDIIDGRLSHAVLYICMQHNKSPRDLLHSSQLEQFNLLLQIYDARNTSNYLIPHIPQGFSPILRVSNMNL